MRNIISAIIIHIVVIIILCRCSVAGRNGSKEIENIFGQEINISNLLANCESSYDITRITNSSLTVLVYTDSAACVPCKFQPAFWKRFIPSISKMTKSEVSFIFVFNSSNREKTDEFIAQYGFKYPVYYYESDFVTDFSLPQSYNTHAFLLDSAYRILLIGNPATNSKIKDLYIRTICEQLSINQQEAEENQGNYVQLGTFSWKETKTVQFIISNNESNAMSIDSLYTSCECTEAEINKREILPSDSAIVSVTFKTDKAESFLREVYVDIHSHEQMVMTIEGIAVD